MSLRQKLRNTLLDEERVEKWKEIIDSTINNDSRRLALLGWIKEYRNEFLDFLEVVDDPDEVRASVLHRYIELKCKWNVLNTHMQYQTVKDGKPDPALIIKGSLISSLSEILEQLLDDSTVEGLNVFFESPDGFLTGNNK